LKTLSSDGGCLPLVSVGIPTYNRPELLARKLDQVCNQTYSNLEIIVSDNASPGDGVRSLLEERANRDSRLKIFFQPCNRGPAENFLFVQEQAHGEFFAWAADDDGWETNFVELLMKPLMNDRTLGMSFCNIDVRYPDGSICNNYPAFLTNFKKFENPSAATRLGNYACQEENLGKANLFYSIFRLPLLRQVDCRGLFHGKAWGRDMLLVAAMLARGNVSILAPVLYHVGISAGGANASSLRPKESAGSERVELIEGYRLFFWEYLKIVWNCSEVSLRQKLRISKVVLEKWNRWMKHNLNIIF